MSKKCKLKAIKEKINNLDNKLDLIWITLMFIFFALIGIAASLNI